MNDARHVRVLIHDHDVVGALDNLKWEWLVRCARYPRHVALRLGISDIEVRWIGRHPLFEVLVLLRHPPRLGRDFITLDDPHPASPPPVLSHRLPVRPGPG